MPPGNAFHGGSSESSSLEYKEASFSPVHITLRFINTR